MLDPRVFGAKERAPPRGASFPTLYNELMDFCATQMGHPWGDGKKRLRGRELSLHLRSQEVGLNSSHD